MGDGAHQALEAKEGLTIKPESTTIATITYQNFFRQYGKIAGMTGTALTEASVTGASSERGLLWREG